MVDSGNSKNKPQTIDVPGQGYKSYSNNEMDFPLVINNPVKNPFVIPGLKKMQIDPQLNHAYTFEVGEVAEATKKLLQITKESLYVGIRETKVGNRVEDIGYAIQTYCESHGYGVVRELCGHGLGRKMHEDPEVANYGKRGRGKKLVNGMVIAIEPMINLGTKNIIQHKDGWTITTADNKPSAHFEHDVAIVNGKPELLSTFAYIYEALGIVSNEEDGLREKPLVL